MALQELVQLDSGSLGNTDLGENKDISMLDDAVCSSQSESSGTLKTDCSLSHGIISQEMNEPIEKKTSVDGKANNENAKAVEVALKDTKLVDTPKDAAGEASWSLELEAALEHMFNTIANSNIHVKSQQKDEPDLTHQQKVDILRDLFTHRPVVFLERFRKVLQESHLVCFSHLAGDYEVDFYCNEIRKSSLKKVNRTRVRNKRYAALQELIKDGEYFSDQQMRSRDPLMYEQYIGQYLTDEELLSQNSKEMSESCCLSGFLMKSYQEAIMQRRIQTQQEQEDACMEEEEEEEDDVPTAESEDWVPNDDERIMLREEFTSRMHQYFLDGKDKNFDYSEVDDNPDYDNLDIVNRDEEERYFDDDDDDEEEEEDGGGDYYDDDKAPEEMEADTE